jgi:SAM-dependent methyltransferase
MLRISRKLTIPLNFHGLVELIGAVANRVIPRRPRPGFRSCIPYVAGKVGLEVGGPTHLFRRHRQLPIYPLAARVDNCNFSHQTVWEGAITEGTGFRFDRARPLGRQYVGEATDLGQIPADAYDFLLSSHVLEHISNPIKALREWLRILKPGGLLVLVLPHKERTFDHRRPITPLSHLLEDDANDVTEADLTHLDEILALHDLKMDPKAGTPEAFRQRSLKNLENRCLHHHVFDLRLALALAHQMNLQILAAESFRPNNILVVAAKLEAGQQPENAPFLMPTARPFLESPFPSDRSPASR